MKLVAILHENGKTYIASREDTQSGCDVPLRTFDGRPRGVNIKASSIVKITKLPPEASQPDEAAEREQAIREKAIYGGHAALWRSKNGPTSRR